mgnify:CR=1 FL=1
MSTSLFEAVRLVAPTLSAAQRRVLDALLFAPDHSASAGELRTILRLSAVVEVNAEVGRIGRKLYKLMGTNPDGLSSGEFEWWHMLATGELTKVRGFVWTLREEVVRGLLASGFSLGGRGVPKDAPAPENPTADATVEEFHDAIDVSAHDAFQRWRISHSDGYYLNLETRNKAKLHGCQCWHAGGANLSATELGGSLTLKKKVCSDEPAALLSWANRHRVPVAACAHCIDGEAFAEIVSPAQASDSPSVASIEGIVRETVALIRGRNRALRDAALKRSCGVCAACEIDFSRVLDGKGYGALQVHHTKQLSLLNEPTSTSIDDLAVVCANCHALIHADPDSAIPVSTLRKMWKAESSTSPTGRPCSNP